MMPGVHQVTISPAYSLGPEQIGQLRSLPPSINSSGATPPAQAAYLRYRFNKLLNPFFLMVILLLCLEIVCSWDVYDDSDSVWSF